MKHSRILFSFLVLFFISDMSPAAMRMQQDSQSQEKRETAQKANSTETEESATPKPEDLPFLGRPIVGIEFRGNRAFTSEELLSHIKQIKLGEKFKLSTREILQSDLDRLRVLFYANHGYLQARFLEPELENTLTNVKITIPVEEGSVYRAGKIEIIDAKLFSKDEIREIIGLKKGEIIKVYEAINKGIEALKQKYGERGYAGFDVYFQLTFHDSAVDGNEAIADIEFIIEEGDAYRIGKIIYIAPDSGTEKLLRANLLIQEGEIFNRTLFDASMEKLFRLLKQENLYHICFEENHKSTTDEAHQPMEIIFHLQKEVSPKSPPVLLKRKK
jgi:outer membrane protein assembly factor BamA